MRLILLCLAAVLSASPGLAQDPRGRKPDADDPSPRSPLHKGHEAEEIQGCWRLVDIQLEGLPEEGARGTGVLLIDGPYIALELHRAWSGRGLEHRIHQSYLGEYRVENGTELRVMRYLGSYLDEVTGELDWLPAGAPLSYRFRIEEERLLLEFNERDRMVFAPLSLSLPAERDLFGRSREASSPRETDIYGRRRSGSTPGDDDSSDDDTDSRDIFGRRRAPKEKKSGNPHLGCWRMRSITLDDLPRNGDRGPGYLLLTENFIVLGVQKTWNERGEPFDVHQTFIGEYRLTRNSLLQVRSIVGSRLEATGGQLLFEGPGTERQYELLDARNDLTLNFEKGNSMTFSRQAEQLGGGTDIFGRRNEGDGPPRGRDPFGRSKK